jgi:hypothetical protein
MFTITKDLPPSLSELKTFSSQVDFKLPDGLIDFYRSSNGAILQSDAYYTELWHLQDMFKLNALYEVEQYAPEFFVFASDGGGTAFAIEKSTGDIYEMQFIGMSRMDAVLIACSFQEFIDSRLK